MKESSENLELKLSKDRLYCSCKNRNKNRVVFGLEENLKCLGFEDRIEI